VFVINGDSGSITVVDPQSNSAIATIKVGAGLEAAAADGKGKLFVDGIEQHDLIAIDTHTNAVLAHYPMPGCIRPHGIAVDGETRRVFVTCVNKAMIVVDADKGTDLASLPIGAGSDGAAFDPKRKLALSSNGEGTLSVVKEVDAAHFVKLGDVATQPSARTIAIDPATGRIFLPAATIAKTEPPTTSGGRPRITFVPSSLKLLVLEPTI
jgi:YVTN family beta-propeller protein